MLTFWLQLWKYLVLISVKLKKDLSACGEMSLTVLRASWASLFQSVTKCWTTQSFYFDRKGVRNYFLKMWHNWVFQRNRLISTSQIKTKMQLTKWSVQIKEGLPTKTQFCDCVYSPGRLPLKSRIPRSKRIFCNMNLLCISWFLWNFQCLLHLCVQF